MRNYRILTARECLAELTPDPGASWFGPYLPGELVLGDPGARDAALHAIQACIPHRRILPTGISRLAIRRAGSGASFVHAIERLRDGSNFVYDLQVTDSLGEVLEEWEGLRLRAVEDLVPAGPWPEPLLAPYLERRLEELVPQAGASLALERQPPSGRTGPVRKRRRETSDAALRKALGKAERIWRRADGKPVSLSSEGLSVAHADDLMLAVTGRGGSACDLESVTPRSEPAWRDLLGEDRFRLAQRLAREQSETFDAAATRLWTVAESLKKAGLPPQAPLVLESLLPDRWVVLRSGQLAIASCVLHARESKAALAVAVAMPTAPTGGPAALPR